MHGSKPRRMTAAELVRNFGRAQDEAAAGPIVVTHHGQPRSVLLSASEHERLLAGQARTDTSAAQAQRRKLLLILDSIAEAYVSIDREWRYRTINRAAELYLGHPRDELIGRSWTEAFPNLRGSDAEASLRRAMEHGEAVRFNWASVVHPGRRIDVHAFPLPLPEGGIGVLFRNVGERELTERRLRAAEARLRALLAELPGWAALSYDTDGTVTAWSSGAESLLGWSAAEMIGRSVEPIFAPSALEAGAPWNEMARARRSGRAEALTWHRRKDGEPTRLRDLVVPLGTEPAEFLKLLRPAPDEPGGDEKDASDPAAGAR